MSLPLETHSAPAASHTPLPPGPGHQGTAKRHHRGLGSWLLLGLWIVVLLSIPLCTWYLFTQLASEGDPAGSASQYRSASGAESGDAVVGQASNVGSSTTNLADAMATTPPSSPRRSEKNPIASAGGPGDVEVMAKEMVGPLPTSVSFNQLHAKATEGPEGRLGSPRLDATANNGNQSQSEGLPPGSPRTGHLKPPKADCE